MAELSAVAVGEGSVQAPSAPLLPTPRRESERFVSGFRLLSGLTRVVNLVVSFWLFNLYTNLKNTCSSLEGYSSGDYTFCSTNSDCAGDMIDCNPANSSQTVKAFGVAVGWFILSTLRDVICVAAWIAVRFGCEQAIRCSMEELDVSSFGLLAAKELEDWRERNPKNCGTSFVSVMNSFFAILYGLLHGLCIGFWWNSGPVWIFWTCSLGLVWNGIVLLFSSQDCEHRGG